MIPREEIRASRWTTDARRAAKKATYVKRRGAGQCARCPNPAEPGRAICGTCSKQTGAAQRKRVIERHEKGLCIRCGKPAGRHRRTGRVFWRCEVHRNQLADLAAKRDGRP